MSSISIPHLSVPGINWPFRFDAGRVQRSLRIRLNRVEHPTRALPSLSQRRFETADNARSNIAECTHLPGNRSQNQADGFVANRLMKCLSVAGSSPSQGPICGVDHEWTTDSSRARNRRFSAACVHQCESCKRTTFFIALKIGLPSERTFG